MVIFGVFFVEIYMIGLQHAESVMILTKFVTHYGPWTDCSYYNLKTTDPEGSPYPPPGGALSCSVGVNHGNLHITKPNKTKTKKLTKKSKRNPTIKSVVKFLCFLLSD